jgi:hypothetical protein
MSITYNPKVVTDGLVLCLDAANKRSYPGTGTTWTDLVGGDDGTLTNGPTFSSDNGGSIVFDGSDDYVVTSSNVGITGASPRTLCFWFYYISSGTGWQKNVLGYGVNGIADIFDVATNFSSYYRIVGHFYGGGYDTGSTLPSRDTLINNDWNYICVSYDSTDVYVYTNGLFSNSKTLTLTTVDGVLHLGKGTYATYNPFTGKISNVSIYNRALTADEILQNYNATRGRYR